MRGLRVAMLAPISWRVPPRHYGPWELVVSHLTEGLVARDVEVTLFATADSVTSARLEAVCPRPLSEDPSLDPKVWEGLHIGHAFTLARDADILHNHYDFLPLTYSRLVDVPIVMTIHGFSSENILPVYERYADRVRYVAISDADRSPRLSYAATIHHGIPFEDFTLGTGAGGYLLSFGRIHPDKGVAEAIAVARGAGLPLVIAGIVHDTAYFEREVAPHVDGERVRYVGAVGPDQRNTLLGEAVALVHLVNFDEPFGLAMVEAMACGTPVIARPRGAIREVVDEGITGAIVDGVDAAIAAVTPIAALDRAAVRARAESRFSRERMVDQYLALYARILAGEA
ncbi:MAG TPA: glycosyltransferase family 4 protein [Candidatus Limnocylindria bacterium]